MRIGPALGPIADRTWVSSALGAIATWRETNPPIPIWPIVPLAVAIVVLANLLSVNSQLHPTWYVKVILQFDRCFWLLMIGYSLYKAAPLYRYWMNRQPIDAIILAIIIAILFGLVGRDFGLGDLFWHQRAATQVLAGLSLALLCSVMFALSFLDDRHKRYLAHLVHWSLLEHGWAHPFWPAPANMGQAQTAVTHSAWHFLSAMALPLILLLFSPYVYYAALQPAPTGDHLGDWRLPLGLAGGFLLASLVLVATQRITYLPAFSWPAAWLRKHPRFRHLATVVLLLIPVALSWLFARLFSFVWYQIHGGDGHLLPSFRRGDP